MPPGLPSHQDLSSSSAARRLGISRAALRRAVAQGDLAPARYTPGGHPRFTPEAVDDYARLRLAFGEPPVPPRWQAQAARVGEERFRALFQGNPLPTYIWQQAGDELILIDHNIAATTWSGTREMLGHTMAEVWRLAPEVVVDCERCLRERTTVRRRSRLRLLTIGEERDVVLHWMFLPPSLVVAQIQDVGDLMSGVRERARLAAIEDGSDDAIIVQNLEGIIEHWNGGAVRLYGYAPEEVIGRSIALLVPPDRTYEIPWLLAHARAGARIDRIETVRVGKDGAPREMSLSLLPVRDDMGHLVEAVSIAREITSQKEAERQAARARAAAEDLAQLRADFVATTSHELRTPLTGILGFAELLRLRWDQVDEATRLRQLDRIIASAQRQKRLIDDLLLLDQIDAVLLVAQREPVLLEPLVRRTAEEVAARYRGLRVDCAGPGETQVLADADRLLPVVANLVDNAAKYAPEGSPIGIWWAHEGGMVALRVRDRGPGIPEQERDRLFTRFGRVSGSRMREGRVGTGLGLYLSRQLARAMGGDLVLEASGHQGTVFRLVLPRAD